jgi:hypothetical protein
MPACESKAGLHGLRSVQLPANTYLKGIRITVMYKMEVKEVWEERRIVARVQCVCVCVCVCVCCVFESMTDPASTCEMCACV